MATQTQAEAVALRKALVDDTANAADVLKRFIATCRTDGMTWQEISLVIKLPEFCVRVIAGDIKRNRMTPENQRAGAGRR